MMKLLVIGALVVTFFSLKLVHAAEVSPEACKSASQLVGQLEKDLIEASAVGDKGLAQATAFANVKTISDADSTAFYDATTALEAGIEKMMKTVQSIDAVFPTSNDVSAQLTHMKMAMAIEPLKTYGKTLLTRMMATINCDVGPDFAACQARVIAPSYFFEKDGERKTPYENFKKQAADQIVAMKVFLRKNVCGNNFEFLTPLPPGIDAEIVAPKAVAEKPAPAPRAPTAPRRRPAR